MTKSADVLDQTVQRANRNLVNGADVPGFSRFLFWDEAVPKPDTSVKAGNWVRS